MIWMNYLFQIGIQELPLASYFQMNLIIFSIWSTVLFLVYLASGWTSIAVSTTNITSCVPCWTQSVSRSLKYRYCSSCRCLFYSYLNIFQSHHTLGYFGHIHFQSLEIYVLFRIVTSATRPLFSVLGTPKSYIYKWETVVCKYNSCSFIIIGIYWNYFITNYLMY